MKAFTLMIILLAIGCSSAPQKSTRAVIQGQSYAGKEIKIDPSQAKTTVVVFLSATCPCSNSHIPALTNLQKNYPHIQFIGIHSNADERAATGKAYFEAAQLGFPVIRDTQTKYAKHYGAVQTPHAFVLDREGTVLYQGAVTSSSIAQRAEQNYLQDALYDINAGRQPATSKRKTLGCYITLKE